MAPGLREILERCAHCIPTNPHSEKRKHIAPFSATSPARRLWPEMGDRGATRRVGGRRRLGANNSSFLAGEHAAALLEGYSRSARASAARRINWNRSKAR